MSKIDDFKKFALNNPQLINEVKNNGTSWQKLYELYDIYGENTSIWDKYLSSKEKSLNIKNIISTLKNINIDSLEENINSIQKVASLIEDFTKEEDSEKIEAKREEVNNIYK